VCGCQPLKLTENLKILRFWVADKKEKKKKPPEVALLNGRTKSGFFILLFTFSSLFALLHLEAEDLLLIRGLLCGLDGGDAVS